jgi:glutaredoxin-like protein NrdH
MPPTKGDSMKIPVTVYTTPNCVQCNQTKRVLDREGIEYTVVDLSSDPQKLQEFKDLGHLTAPIVTTDTKIWSGFRLPKILSLASYIHSQERS